MATTELEQLVKGRSITGGFSRVQVAMVLSDPHQTDNPIVYANEAFQRITGYSSASIIGRNCRFLQGPDTDKRTVDLIRQATSENRDVSVEILNYRANGEPFMNRLIVAPVAGDNGKTRFFLGIQKEIDDHERTGAAAENAAHLDQMLARMQHDLSMLVQSLRQADDEEVDFLALNRRLECMQLVYEEMELQDAHLTNLGLDMGALLSRVGSAVSHDLGRSGLRYTQNVEPMEADLDTAVRVTLLLSELLSNAFLHAFDRMDQGLVELSVVRLAAGGLRIMVTDDGVGIPSSQTFPDAGTRGGNMVRFLLDGLDGTLNHVRGAAGSVFIIDVPLGG